MLKISLLFLGYLLMVYGITYVIIYINLFSFGYTIKEYLYFLFTTLEGYLLPLGIILTIIGLNIRRKHK